MSHIHEVRMSFRVIEMNTFLRSRWCSRLFFKTPRSVDFCKQSNRCRRLVTTHTEMNSRNWTIRIKTGKKLTPVTNKGFLQREEENGPDKWELGFRPCVRMIYISEGQFRHFTVQTVALNRMDCVSDQSGPINNRLGPQNWSGPLINLRPCLNEATNIIGQIRLLINAIMAY